jgi:hypothetical protein
MDPMQEAFERAMGDQLVKWLNARDGTTFTFQCRGDEAPDLIYRDGSILLPIEVVAAYYDPRDASFQWQNARKHAGAPSSWVGKNFNVALKENIIARIEVKCRKAYGQGCILLVSVRPGLTSMPDFQKLLKDLSIPEWVPFEAIYIAGEFPATIDARSGYYAWQVWPQDA